MIPIEFSLRSQPARPHPYLQIGSTLSRPRATPRQDRAAGCTMRIGTRREHEHLEIIG